MPLSGREGGNLAIMRRRIGIAALPFVSALLGAPSATADEKHRCIDASEQGQELRDEGRYSSARDAFAACARITCPALVRRDCGRWEAELEQRWPSVVVRV